MTTEEKTLLNTFISKIKEIDKALDAYEYASYTFEEYKNAIKLKQHGTDNLRNKYLRDKHLWSNWMESTLQKCKTIANLWYSKKINTIEKEEIERTIKMLNQTKNVFKKNTDNLSLYPIQSEIVVNRLTDIANILYKYNEERKNDIERNNN